MGDDRAPLDEGGYGTVAALALLLVAVLVGVVVVAGAAVFAVKVRVQASADMVALAGGQAQVQALTATVAADPCAVARELAARNQVRLDECVVEPAAVRVQVSEAVRLPGLSAWLGEHLGQGGVRVWARARAGVEEVPAVETVRAEPVGSALTASHQHSASFPSSLSKSNHY